MFVYSTGLDVSSRHVDLLTRALQVHHHEIGTPWRALSKRAQAVLILAYLRKNETYPSLASGFGIGVATPVPLRP